MTSSSRIFEEFSLAGKVGIVSGGAGALGLESTTACLEAGAKVYVLDLASVQNTSANFQKQLELWEGKLFYTQASVTDKAATETIVKEISNREGRLDFCVAANGYLHEEYTTLDIPEDVIDKAMKINAYGSWYLAQAAGKEMVRWKNGGAIVFYASIAGYTIAKKTRIEPHLWSAYSVAKAAVLQLTRSCAVELAPYKIRVNSISPGQLWTAMSAQYLDGFPETQDQWTNVNNPMKRLGQPHEMRGVTLFLVSDASTFMTGTDLVLDGGMTLW